MQIIYGMMKGKKDVYIALRELFDKFFSLI